MGKFLVDTDALTVVPMNTGGTEPRPPIAVFNQDGTITLGWTGHRVAAANPGEGLGFYFERVAASIGANPATSGALIAGGADYYNVGRTGNAILDIAVQVDAFAHPEAYGLGGPGAPPVAAGPNPVPPTEPTAPASGEDTISDTLEPAVSKTKRIKVGASVAYEVDLKPGLFRFALAEWQSSPSRWAAALSRTPHSYEEQPIHTQGTAPSGNCTIGSFEPFTPGKWYLNVKLVAAGKEGDTNEAFKVTYYN